MTLNDEERELLRLEAAQALDQVQAPQLRALYAELQTAADLGEVPEELVPALQDLLEIGLESGRIRRVHTAQGEATGRRLWGRTPRGRGIQQSAEEVSEALQALAGRPLTFVSLSASGPASYTLTLGTDRGRLLVKLERQGARLQSLEVG